MALIARVPPRSLLFLLQLSQSDKPRGDHDDVVRPLEQRLIGHLTVAGSSQRVGQHRIGDGARRQTSFRPTDIRGVTLESLRPVTQLNKFTLRHSPIRSSVALQAIVKTSDKNHATRGLRITGALGANISFKEALAEFNMPVSWSRCERPTMNFGSCFMNSFTVSFAAPTLTPISRAHVSNRRPAKTHGRWASNAESSNKA